MASKDTKTFTCQQYCSGAAPITQQSFMALLRVFQICIYCRTNRPDFTSCLGGTTAKATYFRVLLGWDHKTRVVSSNFSMFQTKLSTFVLATFPQLAVYSLRKQDNHIHSWAQSLPKLQRWWNWVNMFSMRQPHYTECVQYWFDNWWTQQQWFSGMQNRFCWSFVPFTRGFSWGWGVRQTSKGLAEWPVCVWALTISEYLQRGALNCPRVADPAFL